MPGETSGIVFDIKKFAIHDGPGIRTTVFLKGCYLNCWWCHNPESISPAVEIVFAPEKCIGCLECTQRCPYQCHFFSEQQHRYERENCVRCGLCVKNCFTGALEMVGKRLSVTEVMQEVLRDQPFYQNSGGGLTISGGEPMAQFQFTKDLLQAARREQLHTCLDTSGFIAFEKLRELIELVDIFLFDLKETNPAKHREYVGVPIDLILENLFQLDRCGATLILRCPVIPGLNDRADHFLQITDYANRLRHLQEIDILPYHPLGRQKGGQIGLPERLPAVPFPDDATVNQWLEVLRNQTTVPVKKG